MAGTPGTFRFPEVAATPSAPPAGYALLYIKTDNVLYLQDSSAVEIALGSASSITSLIGDVLGTGPGATTTTVAFVGGKSAADVAQSVTDTQNATSANTVNFIVKRDSSGDIFVTHVNGVVVEAHAARHLPSGADPLTTAAPVSNLNATTTNATGSANSLARSDHSHAIDTDVAATQIPDQSNGSGSSPSLARADHVHNIPTATPTDIGSANAPGSAATFVKSDHVHKGVHSVKANSGSARFGDLSLKSGVGATVTDDGSGNFTIDVNGGSSELFVSYPGSGLSVNYTAGKVIFNGTETFIASGSVVVSPSLTGGFVYVDVNGTVQSGATLPPNRIPLAIFNSGLTSVTLLTDARVFLAQDLVWGLSGDIQAETTSSSASAGVLEKYARADHVHPITSGAAITQTPDQANAAGSSPNFSKADHIHDIPTGVASGLDANSTNTQGSTPAFARQDHTHSIATGVPSTQNPDQSNAAGSSANLARADHIHDIPTDVPVNTGAINAQGSSTKFARADHVHNVPAGSGLQNPSGTIIPVYGTPVTQTPDQSNTQGSSNQVAMSDHVHDIPTGAASGLDASSSNTQGSASAFTRQDHTHHIASGAPSTQTPDQANTTGTATNFARADHIHDIPTAAPIADLTPNTTNAQGAASTFARSDHSHAIDSAVPVTQNADQSNALGSSAAFSKSDHIHNIPTDVPVTQNTDVSNTQGSSTKFAKADHIHNIPTDVPVQIGTTNALGSATKFSRADHVHAVTWGVIGGLIISTYTLGANAVITAADSLVVALGKLQGQINAIVGSAITSLTGDITGTGPGATATTIATGAVTDTKGSLSNKPAVTVVATSNQTLSGTPTIDGQATTAGTSIVLLTAQTSGSENGPWIVQSGAWTRPTWYPAGGTTQSFQFITTLVRLGTVYGGSTWRQTTAAPITINTTATTWVVTPQSGNFKSQYTVGPQSGSADVVLAFANAFVGSLIWNPASSFSIRLPTNQGAAGTVPVNDGTGQLSWTNPNTNIDGGAPDSVYTISQSINGGTP